MMLLFLIMRCTPTIRELIAATPLSLSSQRLPASRLLLPRSGLERSDFVRWPIASVSAVQRHVWSWGKTGSNRTTVKMALMTRNGLQPSGSPAIRIPS